MSLRGWEALKCPAMVERPVMRDGHPFGHATSVCGSDEFLAVHNLKWKEGSGTSATQTSWKCAKCGEIAGTGKMIDVVQVSYLQTKIDELKAQQNNG